MKILEIMINLYNVAKKSIFVKSKEDKEKYDRKVIWEHANFDHLHSKIMYCSNGQIPIHAADSVLQSHLPDSIRLPQLGSKLKSCWSRFVIL